MTSEPTTPDPRMPDPTMLDLDRLDFTKGNGLVTVVAQDAVTGAVLMVAHADREALARTLETGEMHYRSRSRGLWHKGATSGNVQRVVSLAADCDGDAVLARVTPAGPACHTGERSCFYRLGEDELPEAGDPLMAGIARAVNGIAHQNARLTEEISRVSTTVGRQGHMNDRASLQDTSEPSETRRVVDIWLPPVWVRVTQ